MRNIDNGKKWGRLHETLRAWVQGKERLMHSFGRGCSYLSENEGTCEFLGSFIESSPVWRSTELPLNPCPRWKQLSYTCKAQVKHRCFPRSTISFSPSPLHPLNICVLRLPDMPFMAEITCLGTDTWNSLKVHRITNDQINKTEAARRALPIHPPPTPPFPSHASHTPSLSKGIPPSPGRRFARCWDSSFHPRQPLTYFSQALKAEW